MTGRKTLLAVLILQLANVYNAFWIPNRELSPIVETKVGQVQGFVSISRGGRKFYKFLGLPYAQPPVGELRFESPLPVKKWDGVKDAGKLGPECAQLMLLTRGFGGKEDCLYLNIFVPQLQCSFTSDAKIMNKTLMPVMVFIHGGAFITGSSNTYRPSYFMDEDIILITINYRLAALGFLNTGDGVVRGNMGLKDQSMALSWVQQNIKAFGGDPTQVTLFGESAGASSASFHLLSPMSKGLFSKAILQSGVAISIWSTFKEPMKQAKRFALKFGCPTDNTSEMVNCMKRVETEEFVKAHEETLEDFREQITIFTPTIETVQDEKAFITDDPFTILKSGKINKVPIISGVNSDEGLLFSSIIAANQTKLDQVNDQFYLWAGLNLGYPQERKDLSNSIRNLYFPNVRNIASANLIRNYTTLMSDRYYFSPLHRFARNYPTDASMYLYFFAYKGDFSLSRILASTQRPSYLPVIAKVVIDIALRWVMTNVFRMKLDHPGVCHGDELAYFYNWQISLAIKSSSQDFPMSRDLVSLWANFASNDGSLKFRGVEWTKTESTDPTLRYLRIDENPSMIDEPFAEGVKFWESLDA